ncbi:formylglycine-generating enzyme family protein [Leptolyngbyaceae cyanobacterium CCMR0081]|uniref:Formylglycine-generating enzyme family protein n=2 Tax=Adonisia TaxID=2950183 RepID=A0A6M0RW40_9CYAN|nr:formylglycine-generating enzyme family protein [Adonisia turfae CCMR0081]
MVAIPGNSFIMGSPDDEPGRFDREGPQHEVSIKPFFMSRYPVTQAQWRAVVAMPQVEHNLVDADPSSFKGDTRPVERVSWYGAVEFCQRLSRYADREYRLPTEAEWEYACRAGTTTPFHFGDMITTEVANYSGNSYAGGPGGGKRDKTTPVDYFGFANAYGLSDMHGNVYEWCLDHWHDNYDDAPTNGSAWKDRKGNASRVVRGGSWYNYPRSCRSAYRYLNASGNRDFNIGFRVVRPAPRNPL